MVTKSQNTDALVNSVSMAYNTKIDRFGYPVTLKTVTLPDPNSTAAETYTDSTIKVVFSEVKPVTSAIQDTVLFSADLIAYIKPDQPIKNRDIILYGGNSYEVVGVYESTYMGAIRFKKIALKRQ